MSVESFFHRRLKIGGHKWLPTVQESIVDPLDDGREISYRAIRQCALCKCIEKDWRVVSHSVTPPRRTRPDLRALPADWRLSVVGLLLKPVAFVALLGLLVVNAAMVSVSRR